MKNFETSIPGLLVILIAAALFIYGDGGGQTVGTAAGLALGGLGLLRAADANQRQGDDENP